MSHILQSFISQEDAEGNGLVVEHYLSGVGSILF